MEFLYVSEVKLATHKVDNTYVQVVLKEDHDAEIAELVDALKLQRALLDDAEIGDTAFIDGLINKHKEG